MTITEIQSLLDDVNLQINDFERPSASNSKKMFNILTEIVNNNGILPMSDNSNYSKIQQKVITKSDLFIHQCIKLKSSETKFYWISEINNDDILIRTTKNIDDINYNDFLVNISEIQLVLY